MSDLEWEAHPFRAQKGRGLAVLGSVLILSLGLVLTFGSPWWGILAAVILFGSVESFYFPTRFRLSPEGLESRRLSARRSKRWEDVRRVYEDDEGLVLSPYRSGSRLEPYRALRVLFGSGDSASIRREVRERVGTEVEWIHETKA